MVRQQVEKILKEKHISKRTFAELMNVKAQNVNKLLETKNYATIQHMAEILDVDITNLLNPTNESPQNQETPQQTIIGFVEVNGTIHKITDIPTLLQLADSLK